MQLGPVLAYPLLDDRVSQSGAREHELSPSCDIMMMSQRHHTDGKLRCQSDVALVSGGDCSRLGRSPTICRMDTGRIEEAVRAILEAVGEDPDREGLRDTPARVARYYAEVLDGIGRDPADEVDAFFGDEHYQEIVMVKDIPFYSLCEHHLVPFHGKAHVAY